MEVSNLIDPYKLLGVNCNSSISDLKKNYYNLSLLTHPDKGGCGKDFNIVHLAYNYIKEQLTNITDSTYEELEEEFEKFCKIQEETKPPCFYEVYKETNDWLNKFNEEFDNKKNNNLGINIGEGLGKSLGENVNDNPFDLGYGEFMDSRENNLDIDYNPELDKKEPKTKFQTDIIEYKEPKYMPDTIVNYPLDIRKIDDFSELTGDLKMSDYKKTYQDFIEPNKLEETDFPKDLMEYNPEII